MVAGRKYFMIDASYLMLMDGIMYNLIDSRPWNDFTR